MKRILLSLCLLCASSLMTYSTIHATPLTVNEKVEMKNAYKGMFSVVTYNDKGNILHSGYGFFIDNNVGVAAYSLFEDAAKAEVIDYKGNRLNVSRILGANSTYDLVKFSVPDAKKVECFHLSATTEAEKDATLQLVQYTGKKKSQPQSITIESARHYIKYKYYQTTVENTERNIGCPLLDDNGNVVAIVQKNVDEKASKACAIDARFLFDMEVNFISIFNSDLEKIKISKAIPNNEKDAMSCILLMGFKDSTRSLHAIDDFIQAYPDNPDGYSLKSTYFAYYDRCEDSEACMNRAFELAEKNPSTTQADELHNRLSKHIYNKVVFKPELDYPSWNMERAIAEAEKAYQLKPSPFYLLQLGQCYLAQKEYQKAYQHFYKINTAPSTKETEWSAKAESEAWLYAARAYELGMKAGEIPSTLNDSLHVISLIDSTIAALPKPYVVDDAKFFLERAQRNESVKQYRKAVLDYYEYEKIIGPKNLNDKFYYLREQTEIKCHMYQQALDDIQTAIAFDPENPFYPIEKALVQLHAGLFEEAITTCTESLEKLPENPDCYKIMGIAYGELGKKKQAIQHLQKAKELGDPTTDFFLSKYTK